MDMCGREVWREEEVCGLGGGCVWREEEVCGLGGGRVWREEPCGPSDGCDMINNILFNFLFCLLV